MNTASYPFLKFTGPIAVVQSDEELEKIALELQNVTQWGFDTETRPSFKKGEVYQVALLQLATKDKAYIFRLHYLKNFTVLKALFEREDVFKVGLAIRDDLKQLQKVFSFEPKNTFDLQPLAQQKKLKNLGLKGLCEEVLAVTISKGPKTTNWEQTHLTEVQLTYAATDAWISLKLYETMKDLPEVLS